MRGTEKIVSLSKNNKKKDLLSPLLKVTMSLYKLFARVLGVMCFFIAIKISRK